MNAISLAAKGYKSTQAPPGTTTAVPLAVRAREELLVDMAQEKSKCNDLLRLQFDQHQQTLQALHAQIQV